MEFLKHRNCEFFPQSYENRFRIKFSLLWLFAAIPWTNLLVQFNRLQAFREKKLVISLQVIFVLKKFPKKSLCL